MEKRRLFFVSGGHSGGETRWTDILYIAEQTRIRTSQEPDEYPDFEIINNEKDAEREQKLLRGGDRENQ